MNKNKFAEIKNRTAHIHDLLVELEEVIKEVELAEALNTSKEGQQTFKSAQYLIGSTVNELDEYEDMEERKTHCYVPLFGATVIILTIAITTYLISTSL